MTAVEREVLARTESHPDAQILIVDDEEGMVQCPKRRLHGAGHTSLEGTCDPRLVLSLYDRLQPDLLLLDLHLPYLDGFATLAQLEGRLSANVHSPVLILTGDSTRDSNQAALTLGAKDLLAAPLHDVGKLGIQDLIPLKAGKLTSDEYGAIKRHTAIGAGTMCGSRSPLLQLEEAIARYHLGIGTDRIRHVGNRGTKVSLVRPGYALP